MPVVVADSLTKSYGSRLLLDRASLALDDDARVGLVGDNGSGKSTLAKILAGVDTPDTGTVALRRGARVGYLDQEPTFPPDQTARAAVEDGLAAWREATTRFEAVTSRIEAGDGDLDVLLAEQSRLEHAIEQAGGWERAHEVEAALAGLGMTAFEKRCGEMSGGERRRVALAKLLVASPDLAILDEPTNHLDADAIEWLERRLRDRFKGALLLVTHDRWLLDRLVDRTLELEAGALYGYEGGWDAFLEGKAQRVAAEERVEANRRNFLRTELEWLRRSPAARSTKQRARIDRAEAAIAAKPAEDRRGAEFALETTRLGKTIVDARGLGVDLGGRTLVQSLDLTLRKGERIGLVGPNGAGKTTLLSVLLGQRAPTRGEVVRGDNTVFAYLDQARTGLDEQASLEENVTSGHRRVEFGGKPMDSRAYMGRFGFDADAQRKKVSALSGGERARVALAKLLLAPANVLVLDEPTNDLDVTTLSALESMILEADLTALVVSHDRYFLDRVATAILELDGRGGAVLYPGNWDMYRRLSEANRLAREAPAESARPVSTKPEAKAKPKEARGLTYGERLELERLVPRIEALEAELRTLGERLSEPELYATPNGAAPLLAKQRELEAELEGAMERWMTLEAK